MKNLKEIADTWFEAFNEHNLNKLLSLYDENAQHYSPKLKLRQPETQGLIKGKAALGQWWADSFERIPSLAYFPQFFIIDEDRIFMEYLRKAEGDPDMVVGEVLMIKEGKIIASKVYHG